jgi:hypothetical protein
MLDLRRKSGQFGLLSASRFWITRNGLKQMVS